MRIFPEYYNGWGKNLSEESSQKLDDILQKMQLQNYTNGISKYLQSKEKERIVKEKKDKSRGWFSGPKELTAKQIEEIQKYLNDNFGQEVKSVVRPADYHHISLKFTLRKLEVVVTNAISIMKEGLYLQLDELIICFKLRQGGFTVDMTLMDIGFKLYKQIGIEPREFKNILYKIVNKNTQNSDCYLKTTIVSHPL